jgi:flagellar biosynthesis protein FlhF
MRLKSYFSESVEAAMELARKELGDDALLVHARPATPETRYLGAYEVVFGVVPPEPPATNITALPQQEHVSVDSELGRFVALVGPPGAGKTTTLVKLAAQYGLARGRSLHIITADVHRIAAADQLRTLSAILGIGCDIAESPIALTHLLDQHRSKGLILIDTPGFSHRDIDDASDLAQHLSMDDEIDTHLVVPASMKTADLSRMVDAYRIFKPAKLLFTKLDETERLDSLGKEAIRAQLPISFLCSGQQIPEDLEEATIHRLRQQPSVIPYTLGAAA